MIRILVPFIILCFFSSCSESPAQRAYSEGQAGFLFIQDGFPLNRETLEYTCLKEADQGWVLNIKINEAAWPAFSGLTKQYQNGKIALTDGKEIVTMSTVREPLEERLDMALQMPGLTKEEAEKLQAALFDEILYCNT